MEDYRLEQTGQQVQNILNGAAMDANLQAEVERATEAEGRLQDNIDAEERARQDADGLLQQGISDEENRAKRAEEANAGEIEGIKALIPSTASDANKLADTNYVNSSIQTATAEYRGDYNVVTDLHLAIDATHAQIETLLPTVIAEADKNDYCYVMIPTSAQTPTEIAKIERYKMTSDGWKFEYDVNNSTFTAEEWAAIKSGITSGLVAKLNALPTNADLLLLLAGKQDVLTFDATPVPESNNPVKSGGVYSAIDDEKTARLNSDTAIHAEIDGLQAKVPATASSDNKLVDQNQMNTSISTATATYRGDWNVVSDLHLAVDATRAQIAALLPTVISTADNNDYCYVEIPTSAETPTQIERVERYKFNGTAWGYEYVLNNSGFTADQWAAINSMITSGLVAKLAALPTNADLLAMLAQKQDVLTFDSTPTENSTNPVTSGGVFAADKALSDAIEAILLLIPSAASSLNKLVDTSLMNSSISTATATFRGTYNLVSDLGLGIDATEGQIAAALLSAISTADNNDYAFVQIPTSAETPAQIARTDRYKFNGTAWANEYTLNTSGFTAAQWAAINSTITSALVAKLNALPTAAELQEALGILTSGITAINQKIPSTASQSNKLVDNSSMESYIAQVINILDASFNVTSTDGHITLHITQVDGVITSVQVQSTDIASAADLALKASQADLTALASRVTTAEGNITSLTGRMGTAETNIANLQQLYNDLQQSKPVPVIALPSTGQQQGVIYRLAGTASYSDYMWNGSSWVLMATYNNAIDPRPIKASQNLVTSGGVFDNIGALDVSELNATENPHTLAQYADLSAALAAIPTDYQKGGMSIKFVQSSDNKYVQYRLMADTWSTTVTDWQGVDDAPTVGSKNLVESGGVMKTLCSDINLLPLIYSKTYPFDEVEISYETGYYSSSNVYRNDSNWKNTGILPLDGCYLCAVTGFNNEDVVAPILFYDSSNNFVGANGIQWFKNHVVDNYTERVFVVSPGSPLIPSNAAKFRVCGSSNIDGVYTSKVNIYKLNINGKTIFDALNDIEEEIEPVKQMYHIFDTVNNVEVGYYYSAGDILSPINHYSAKAINVSEYAGKTVKCKFGYSSGSTNFPLGWCWLKKSDGTFEDLSQVGKSTTLDYALYTIPENGVEIQASWDDRFTTEPYMIYDADLVDRVEIIEKEEYPCKGKTIFLFGDSISSTDYTWYKEYLERYTKATVLNLGASGKASAYLASNEYFQRLANNPNDIVIALVGANDTGEAGSVGTFDANSELAQMGEPVVTETDISVDYNGNKFIQAISHIIRKWRNLYWNFRMAAGLNANILDTQNDNEVVYPLSGTATESQCIAYAESQGWTLGYNQRYVMMTTETNASKMEKLVSVRQPKFYLCTTLPEKIVNSSYVQSTPDSWKRRRLACIECAKKYRIPLIDLAYEFAIDWDEEPYWPGQGYTGTSKTDNQGIYTMDGLHPNEFGYNYISQIVAKYLVATLQQG